MSRVGEMEARGIGGSDFEDTEDIQEVERFLARLHAQKQARSIATYRSLVDSNSKSLSSTTYVHHNKLPDSFYSSEPPSDLQRLLLQPTEMRLAIGNGRNSSSRPQTTPASAGNSRFRSADPGVKRQMAIDCGLKSVPVNDRKWASSSSSTTAMSLPPPSRLALKDSDSAKSLHLATTPISSQVLLLAREESANVRRGLSGSKIRSGARTPRRDSRTQQFDLLDSSIEQREGSILIAASPRAQSIRYSTPSVTSSAGNENHQPHKGNCKWNRSEQGLRLQKQLSNLNSTRAMKRASEMVQHRLDHMYLMSGNKLKLQHRYSIDDTEMLKLEEMTQTREDLMSDLKKIKYPYSVKSSTSYSGNSLNQRPSHSNGISQSQSQSAFITNPRKVKQQSIVHPSPASELDSARDYARKYHPTHAANKEVGTDEENDINNYYDDDDDVDDDEINSWNGPM